MYALVKHRLNDEMDIAQKATLRLFSIRAAANKAFQEAVQEALQKEWIFSVAVEKSQAAHKNLNRSELIEAMVKEFTADGYFHVCHEYDQITIELMDDIHLDQEMRIL